MRKFHLWQLALGLTLISLNSFSQISNTAHSITLQNNPSGIRQQVCPWIQSIPSGTYTIQLHYTSLDFSNYGSTVTTAQVSGTVTNNISTTGQMILSVPTLNLPTDGNDGWSLVLTEGTINISGGGLTGTSPQSWQFEQFDCAALPIFLTAFSVDYNYIATDHYKINWQTMQETNTSHFILQTSSDGRHFSDVLMEPAAGQSSSTINYTAYANGGFYRWFRLKAIDLDGDYQYSWIIFSTNTRSTTSSFCSFTYLEGPDKICGSSAVYKLHNVPAGTVNWSLTAYGNITTSNAGLLATVNRTGIGTATLTAAASGSCSKSKSLLLGSPYISGNYSFNGIQYPMGIWFGSPSDYNYLCNNVNASANMQITGATSVTWSKVTSSPSNVYWYQNGNNLDFHFFAAGQSAVYKIEASNGCGTTSYDFGFMSEDCGGGGGDCYQYQVAPNPAQGSVNISVLMIPPPCDLAARASSKKATDLSISEIRIYDQSGYLKSRQKFANVKTAKVNLNKLRTGIYVVEITDGKYTERQQLVVQN